MGQFGIRELLEKHPVIPVVTFNAMNEVDEVAQRLIKGGFNCIEVTLRTPIALEAIAALKQKYGDQMDIGVGTLVNAGQLKQVSDLGADFIVSPGLLPHLKEQLQDAGIPFIPGVVTPTEVIAGMEMGYDTFKLFPAVVSGGLKLLKTYNAVFPEARFCPTGGINEENHKDFLALPNVICVGGSWVA